MKMVLVILVMFWNVENFFDYFDSGTSGSDREFSSMGERHWTKKRFQAKCSAVAKTIYYVAEHAGGDLPDVVGLAEVENAFVLRRLLSLTNLKKSDYRIVHFEGPDPRGIDVALLYRSGRLKLLEARPCRVDSVVTRDILLALFTTGMGDSLAVMVNHHPSKYGGASSIGRREVVVRRLCALSDSLMAAGWTQQVVMGDFNDTPDQPLYDGLEERLVNLSDPPAALGLGTIKFNGKWELIDQCLVSAGIADRCTMDIVDAPFLTVPDRGHSGLKPFRTYSGPRYIGGVSDHYPVTVCIDLDAVPGL